MSDELKIEADSSIGRCLIALRAGPMSSGELTDRLGNVPSLNNLQRRGLVASGDNGWRLTDAGRKVCPLRNPLAGALATVPPGAMAARSVPLQRLPTINNQPPARQAGTTGGISMNESASKKQPNGSDRVLQALAGSPEGIARKALITTLSDLPESIIDNAICRLVKSNKVERIAYGVLALAADRSKAEKTVDVVKPPVEIAMPAPVIPEVTANHEVKAADPVAKAQNTESQPAPEIVFSIYSDGRLAIIDGDEVLVLPPDATRRLGYFLGCFEITSWPPRFDHEVTVAQST